MGPLTCPHCGEQARPVVRRRGRVYYVDLDCAACGHVTVDGEGGV